MRILVTGGRDFVRWNLLNNALNEYGGKTNIVVVHGDCPTGADALADRWAQYQGVRVERYPAQWELYGKSAGPIRNAEMVAMGADVCLAFPTKNSRGTWDCIRKAQNAGIETRVFV